MPMMLLRCFTFAAVLLGAAQSAGACVKILSKPVFLHIGPFKVTGNGAILGVSTVTIESTAENISLIQVRLRASGLTAVAAAADVTASIKRLLP